jgi:hypothetical protein
MKGQCDHWRQTCNECAEQPKLRAPNSVVQSWVTTCCTWKEQTVLFCALRGPDNNGSPELKSWTRWIRSIVLQNAAPNKTFMQRGDTWGIAALAYQRPLVFDMLPVHFLTHFMHALQVIGCRHPDSDVTTVALTAYGELCEYLHVRPELDQQMTARLQDEV